MARTSLCPLLQNVPCVFFSESGCYKKTRYLPWLIEVRTCNPMMKYLYLGTKTITSYMDPYIGLAMRCGKAQDRQNRELDAAVCLTFPVH